jgi:hypothetical protein
MHDFSPLGDAKPSMAAFNLPPGLKNRPKTALREVRPERLVVPPEEAVDDGPWDRVFVGVHYAEGLSRLFQSGLTQRRRPLTSAMGHVAHILISPRHVRFNPNNGIWAAHPSLHWLSVYEYTP